MLEDVTHNRRQNIRVPFETNLWIYPSGSSVGGIFCERTRDLGLKGIYCYTDNILEINTGVEIRLQLLGSSSALSLQIKAHVVRVDSTGMALKFEEMDIDSLFYLKNILYYNSGDPDQIDKELYG